ncbi:phosphate transporter PHO1 homolog 10-like isoform X2 [Capsicum annuum]|uniref:phosphate transporter PHO1 homolog 10-like isoform X2 n=1 Tax=Capsicum annuum TaxID=4072 RepID=UPI001FB0E781|nr:phosphate transporter PHO1 homolog 10-like isoform X2 [Capsicum annuum]
MGDLVTNHTSFLGYYGNKHDFMVIIPYHGKLLSKQAVSDINYKRKGDIENQESEIGKNHHENSTNLWNGNLFIPAEIGQKEKSFFEKLDNELEKVNSFYKVQVEEAKDEAAALGKQMDALIALRKKVKEKDRKGDKATNAASSKVTSPSRASSEEKKQLDFKEEVDKFGENIIKPVSSNNNIDPSLYEHGRTPSDVLECVNIQHTSGGPKSSIERLLLATAEKECSFSREELKEVEVKLKKAFVELYQKLRHLNQYSFINLSAFSVILEKYEKITSRKVKRSYMKFVDSSYIGSSDEVNNLLNKVEATFVKHFSNSEQGDAIKLLTPKRKREKCSVRFVSGFFCGFSIALIMAVVLIIKTRKLLDKEEATVYLDSIFPLYSFYGYIILRILFGAANIYLWRSYRINYLFILGFYPGTELHHKEVFLLASGLSVLVLTGCLVQLHIRMDSRIQDYETSI